MQQRRSLGCFAAACGFWLMGTSAVASLLRAGPGKRRLAGCSDEELSAYALAVSIGPATGSRTPPPPQCTPSPRQGLWPLGPPALPASALAREDAKVHAAAPRDAAVSGISVPAASRATGHAGGGIYFPYLAHLYVVQSTEDWCPPPCWGPTWELAAPKPELGSGYALFEAAIWRQERRVALYRFDPAWESRARQAYSRVCSNSWECAAYRVFRERHALLNIGPWPQSAEDNPTELSAFLLSSFKRFFHRVLDEVPHHQHFGITYSGHGALADGSLFEGTVHRDDAKSLLESLTHGMGQVALLNFGGNCAEGRWNMLSTLHPYAEWIIASDLAVGGVELKEEERTAATSRARERLSDVFVLKQVAEASVPVEGMVERIIRAREELWNTVWQGPIVRQRLRQSIAAYHGPDFLPFAEALQLAYRELTASQRKAFKERVEAAECDVLAAARFLEAAVASGAALGLEERFRQMRPVFASTQSLVEWDTALHGLGFNFLGWHEPPCDLVTALGPGAPPPPGGWGAGAALALAQAA
mmetsp:Transcript_12803/g.40167  ORF Transcript_12803/g.40167 Transcript_12803/m.40167 type:complete len:531 (-) Transcript_12803:154-1746(-)